MRFAWFCLLLALPALADTLQLSRPALREIRDVLVLTQDGTAITYLALVEGRVLKRTMEARETGGATRWYLNGEYMGDKLVVQPQDREEVFRNWARASNRAVVERGFGPRLSLIACTILYPLPPNVNYLMGSPSQQGGPFIYLGKEAEHSRVYFHELAALTFKGPRVTMEAKAGPASEGPWLPAWRYGERKGAPPVLLGFDPKAQKHVELPLTELRKLRFENE
jgi:hypothetical protein